MRQPPAHSWVKISERALVANIRAHRCLLAPKTQLMAVVKSNAYGHGLELVARVAERSRLVDWLGAASLAEAEQIRRAGVNLPILVLSYYHPLAPAELARGISHRISFMVYEEGELKALERAAKQAGKPAHIHLKLETGMARLGLFPVQAKKMLNVILKSPYFKLEGVASHFATAESKDQTFLKKQLITYNQFLAEVKQIIPPNVIQHTACSAAITAAPESHLDLVRLGIALYGLWPSAENKKVVNRMHSDFELNPALTWKTQVVEVQMLPKGTPIGYDRSYITKKPIIMAVIPVGYWDGYDRKLSNSGEVIVHGTRVPIIGRICMNISMVDITKVPNTRIGDEVILIGKDSEAEITADEMAKKVGTINYEIVTRINPLLPRVLI